VVRPLRANHRKAHLHGAIRRYPGRGAAKAYTLPEPYGAVNQVLKPRVFKPGNIGKLCIPSNAPDGKIVTLW
jgi:hypothetical protein